MSRNHHSGDFVVQCLVSPLGKVLLYSITFIHTNVIGPFISLQRTAAILMARGCYHLTSDREILSIMRYTFMLGK